MIFREEHPNPQWERKKWRCLNGEWEFDFDFGSSYRERGIYKNNESLEKKINVPFCPESELSGIGYKDFIPSVCYRRIISFTEEELKNNVILHFGAVDYNSYIYINGKEVCRHIGGYSSFETDISDYVSVGENTLFVIAEDDVRSGEQACGKQSDKADSYWCVYTRTTGIWQSVWLEFVPKSYIRKAKYMPDAENGILYITGNICGSGEIKINAFYENRPVGEATVHSNGTEFSAYIKLSEIHLWEPGCGRLYDLKLRFGEDEVCSYFGLRNVKLDGTRFMLNSKTVFQRFVLDQGFYPDGIYTAGSDEELKRDIDLSMAAGFNGARLHQKIFEKRFLYYCDKAGYMVWAEHANWGMDYKNPIAIGNFICEWTEIMERDFNHPSIIGWCPFNETWGYKEREDKNRIIETVYKITKAYDSTRPCIAVSGNYHIAGMEIYDVHNYTHDIAEFKKNYSKISDGIVEDKIYKREGYVQEYSNQPVYVSEYGGFSYMADCEEDWGYGEVITDSDKLFESYKEFTDSLLDNPDIMGFCYTQLYDVEQEKNGLYTYERKPKLDIKKIKAVNTRRAKIEEI